MDEKKQHILLVDDEEAHAELAREALESGGDKFSVTVAGSLEEAKAVLAESDIDLAIVDWSLPDGKGSELLPGSLDAATLPIIIMTAHGDEGLAVEAMKAGALDYVVKSPETLSDMQHIAERSLREWEHISERRRAERALKGSEQRFRTLVELAPVAVYETDAQGACLYVNKKWRELAGLTLEEALGDGWQEGLHKEDRVRIFELWREHAQHQGPWDMEYRFCTPDGKVSWVMGRAAAMRDADGRVTGYLGANVDITERKRGEEERRQLEEQMRQTQKLESLGVMAGGIAHDFNNILYAILGNADLALMEMPPEAVGRDNLREIQTAARRAAGLTDQMLAYSGKGALAIEKMDLSGLVQEMAHLLEVSHTKKAVVNYRFEENLSAIEGDPSQLRQVVMNLITNASEAVGDEGGFITVTTGVAKATQEYLATTYVDDKLPGGRYVYLEVSDTGCGMDEDTQRRMFEPFFTTKFTGRGLGMAAVLGILRAHNGAIDIDSEPGRGTTIRVLFPALDEVAGPQPKEMQKEEDWRGSGTVLVVDDERQLRKLYGITLKQKGFTVLAASDGREAVELFRENQDDIVFVILDLTMPRMGGEDAFVEMRRIREAVPVVLASGYSERQVMERIGDLGFAGFLKKPVQNGVLLDKVRTVLKLTE